MPARREETGEQSCSARTNGRKERQRDHGRRRSRLRRPQPSNGERERERGSEEDEAEAEAEGGGGHGDDDRDRAAVPSFAPPPRPTRGETCSLVFAFYAAASALARSLAGSLAGSADRRRAAAAVERATNKSERNQKGETEKRRKRTSRGDDREGNAASNGGGENSTQFIAEEETVIGARIHPPSTGRTLPHSTRPKIPPPQTTISWTRLFLHARKRVLHGSAEPNKDEATSLSGQTTSPRPYSAGSGATWPRAACLNRAPTSASPRPGRPRPRARGLPRGPPLPRGRRAPSPGPRGTTPSSGGTSTSS